MATPAHATPSLQAHIPALEAVIDREWQALDTERALPDSIADELFDSDVLRMWTPRALGGLELDPVAGLEAIASLSALEGSVGWNAMILGAYTFFAGRLPEPTARRIWGERRGAVAGALQPGGKAVECEGGHRVTGRWTFASGCKHATWLLAQCMVERDGEIAMTPIGLPEMRLVFMPRDQCQVHDVWHVNGLRGTGSHDYSADDVFVPNDESFPGMDGVTRDEPLYSFPTFPLMMSAVSSVPVGIARGALRTTAEILARKQSLALKGRAADHAHIQAELGRARMEALSAERLLFGAVEDAWQSVRQGEEPTLEQRVAIRAGAIHAGESAARAVDICCTLAGSSSIFESNRLERFFRDVHAATRHTALSPSGLETIGRIELGMAPEGLI